MNTDEKPKKVGISNDIKLEAYREFSKTVGETIKQLNEQVKVLNSKIGAKGEVVEKKKSGIFGMGGIFGGRKQQKSRKGGKKQRKQRKQTCRR